jgi:hypothetical protein
MRCPQCRHENPRDAKFCLECGRRPALTCTACGLMGQAFELMLEVHRYGGTMNQFLGDAHRPRGSTCAGQCTRR